MQIARADESEIERNKVFCQENASHVSSKGEDFVNIWSGWAGSRKDNGNLESLAGAGASENRAAVR